MNLEQQEEPQQLEGSVITAEEGCYNRRFVVLLYYKFQRLMFND